MPIQRRLPKRGFTSVNGTTYQTLSVERLNAAASGAVVDAAWLRSARIVRRPGPIKLLAGGDLKHPVTVRVDAASESARKAVEAAGGKVELLAKKATGPKPRRPKTKHPARRSRA
jgi:large subunit ribosomal protein L15